MFEGLKAIAFLCYRHTSNFSFFETLSKCVAGHTAFKILSGDTSSDIKYLDPVHLLVDLLV